MMAMQTWFKRLRANRSGVAMTEFALSMPFLLTAGLWGIETANYALTTMKVSQLAVHLADNASRIGDTSQLDHRRIYESDINDLMRGANVQSSSLDLYEHGRVIVSSLEIFDSSVQCTTAGCGLTTSASNGDQVIHWQRCMGKNAYTQQYGRTGDVKQNGMGPAGEEIIAFDGNPAIFVEVAYRYQPLISKSFVGTPTIKSIASYTVRDDRDLTRIYQRNPVDPVADCNAFNNTMGAGGVPK